jgi:hypothetical protein
MIQNRRVFIILTILVLLTNISGCIPFDNTILMSTQSATHSQEKPTTLISTKIITPTWTGTPPPTSTPIPTYTSTPLTTLAPNLAYSKLRMLLTNSQNCYLPCWLGITPGLSAWQDVTAQLTEFSGISTEWLDIGSDIEKGAYGQLLLPFLEDNMVIELYMSYSAAIQFNRVEIITLQTRSYRLKNGEFYGDIHGDPNYYTVLKNITIPGVLSVYGPPELLFITVEPISEQVDGWWGYAKIYLGYPDDGIFMIYSTPMDGSGNSYKFCPSNAYISGTLIPAGQGSNYQEVLHTIRGEVENFVISSPYIMKPEDAIGMNIEEFYEIFKNPSDRCLETPKPSWFMN